MCTETWIWSCAHLVRKDIPCPKVAQERKRARSRCCWLWPATPRNVCDKGRTHHHSYPCSECEEKERRQREHEERRTARQRARQAVSQQDWEQVPVRGSTPPPPPPPKDRRTDRGGEGARARHGGRDSYIELELYGQAMSVMSTAEFNRYIRPPSSTESQTHRHPKRGKSAVHERNAEAVLYAQALGSLPPEDFSEYRRPPHGQSSYRAVSRKATSQRRRQDGPPPLRTTTLGRELTGQKTATVHVSPVSPGDGIRREVSPIRSAEKSRYGSRRFKQVDQNWRDAGYD